MNGIDFLADTNAVAGTQWAEADGSYWLNPG
jgi:hypothetical protein